MPELTQVLVVADGAAGVAAGGNTGNTGTYVDQTSGTGSSSINGDSQQPYQRGRVYAGGGAATHKLLIRAGNAGMVQVVVEQGVPVVGVVVTTMWKRSVQLIQAVVDGGGSATCGGLWMQVVVQES